MSRHFLSFVFLCAAMAFAGSVWDFPIAEKTEPLEDALRTLSDSDSVSGTFEQIRTIEKINRSFRSSGKFEISKATGILWKIEKPFFSEMRITDSSIVQLDADGVRTEISSKDNAVFGEIARMMRSVLFGDLSGLQKRFRIYFVQNGKNWKIGLVPSEETVQKVLRSIVVEGNRVLKKVELVDGEGNRLNYDFRTAQK